MVSLIYNLSRTTFFQLLSDSWFSGFIHPNKETYEIPYLMQCLGICLFKTFYLNFLASFMANSYNLPDVFQSIVLLLDCLPYTNKISRVVVVYEAKYP